MLPSASAAILTVARSAARRGGGHEVLAAVLDPLEGPAEVVAGQDDDLFVTGEVRLLTEAAADVAHLHADLVLPVRR